MRYSSSSVVYLKYSVMGWSCICSFLRLDSLAPVAGKAKTAREPFGRFLMASMDPRITNKHGERLQVVDKARLPRHQSACEPIWSPLLRQLCDNLTPSRTLDLCTHKMGCCHERTNDRTTVSTEVQQGPPRSVPFDPIFWIFVVWIRGTDTFLWLFSSVAETSRV